MLQRIQGILTIAQGICFYTAAVCWLLVIDLNDYDVKVDRSLLLAWHLYGLAQNQIAPPRQHSFGIFNMPRMLAMRAWREMIHHELS